MKSRSTFWKSSFFRFILHIYLVLYVSSVSVIKAAAEESTPEESTAEARLEWIPTGNGNQKITGVAIDPEGRILAFIRQNDGHYELRIKYLKDRGFGVGILKHDQEIAAPVFGPSGKSIIFSMKKNGYSKIYRKDLRSNTEPQQITQGRSNDFHPSISPDGRLIAFDSDRSGNFDIWLLDLESYQRNQVTRYKNHDFYPRFSPDGGSLIYTSYRNEFFNLFMKNLKISASQPIQLTQEEAVQAHPVFSQDGKTVFFDSNMSGSNQIFNLDLESMEIQQVSQGDGAYSIPVEAQGTLVYLAEEYGVFGVKRQAADAKAKSIWPKLQKKEYQALSQVVKDLKQETKADFEKDLAKVREHKLAVIPSIEVPAVGNSFERAGFELGFLEDRKPELMQSGILTNKTNLKEANPESWEVDPIQNPEKSKENETPNSFDEPSRLPKPRNFEVSDNPTPLEKLWAEAAPSISVEEKAPFQIAAATQTKVNEYKTKVESDPLRKHFSPRMPELVEATFPPADATNVPVYQPLGVVYNRELYEGEQKFMNAKMFEGSEAIEIEVNSIYNKALKRVDIIPKRGLKKGNNYRISIGNATWNFVTEGEQTANANSAEPIKMAELSKQPDFSEAALKITKVFPRNRSKGNRANTPIQVEFNQKIDPASLHSGSLTLYFDGKMVPGEMIFEDNDKVLTLKPYRNLGEAEIYEARLSPDLKSKSGEVLSGKTQWKFKTRYYSPFLVSEFPPSIIDKQDQNIELVFNREIDPSSIKSDDYFLQSNNFRYKGRVELVNSNRTLRFTPHQRIPDQQDFKFYISPNLTDSDGNIVENSRPINLASRFPQDESTSKKVMQRARNYYPKSNSQSNGEQDLLLLESFFAKGYIKDRKARNVSQSQSTSRYKIALMIEEALENLSRMKKQERRDLQILMQKYEQELKNLGVDLKSLEKNISQGLQSDHNNGFTSRGRRL